MLTSCWLRLHSHSKQTYKKAAAHYDQNLRNSKEKPQTITLTKYLNGVFTQVYKVNLGAKFAYHIDSGIDPLIQRAALQIFNLTPMVYIYVYMYIQFFHIFALIKSELWRGRQELGEDGEGSTCNKGLQPDLDHGGYVACALTILQPGRATEGVFQFR